ncbi:plastocyanin [Synechococcus sp. PCC 7502]|uniref:plastocyanin n=1 Tax=Synechococcus sp. PCC 7502 TaxID=1173263 RepID=UPI00029F89DA|nr:plastocyanin [Synechococcus sp. PCC 7502]AFY74202.1 plastocyanin [Synechococcus sp. PCC 7502]
MKTVTSYFKQVALVVLGLLVAFNFFTANVAAETYTVKMGSDKGALVFEPKDIIIKPGDTIKWINNKAYPHNIIVQGEAELSHKKLLVKPAAEVESTFTAPGEYSYYCTPHRGAGMVGKVTVQG